MEPCATVTGSKATGRCRLELAFDDGLRGTVDLKELILAGHGVFEPLHNPACFAQVRVGAELGAVVWPCGTDLCPDVLREWMKGGALQPAK